MPDIRTLRHAIVLAKHLNFTRAAEELGLSQSGLTRSVQVLEEELGMRLFDRDRGSVALSAQGQQYVSAAREMLDKFDDFERSTQGLATGQAGRIRFGMAPLPARVLLEECLAARLQETPGLVFDVPVRNPDALWTMLEAGEIEFFVAGEGQLPDVSALRVEVLGHFPVSLIVRAGHPLLANPHGREHFPVLMSSRHGELSPLVQRVLSRSAPAAHVIEDLGVLAALTRKTDAIWITTDYIFEALDDAHAFRRLNLAGSRQQERYRVMAYSIARRSQSPVAQSILKNFRQAIRAQNSRVDK